MAPVAQGLAPLTPVEEDTAELEVGALVGRIDGERPAKGHDGGGHNSPIGTMALIPQVVDAVGDTPVLGAGGIVDGRGVAAAIMLGAEGV